MRKIGIFDMLVSIGPLLLVLYTDVILVSIQVKESYLMLCSRNSMTEDEWQGLSLGASNQVLKKEVGKINLQQKFQNFKSLGSGLSKSKAPWE